MKDRVNAPDKNWVGVCMSPALIDQYKISESIVVVIDVLRATTSMCVAFGNGARSMIPVTKVETAREYQKQGFLAAAERNGEKIEGFDFGNSPYSYMGERIKDRDIAITTTNGTKALNAARERNPIDIYVGSFANLTVLCDHLVERNKNVVLLCSGWKDRLNLEDTIFAGAMVRKLRQNFNLYQDAALIAETLFRAANHRKRFFMGNSSHFNRMMHLQIQQDVKYSLRRDTQAVLPKLVGDRLYDILAPGHEKFIKEDAKAQKKADQKPKLTEPAG